MSSDSSSMSLRKFRSTKRKHIVIGVDETKDGLDETSTSNSNNASTSNETLEAKEAPTTKSKKVSASKSKKSPTTSTKKTSTSESDDSLSSVEKKEVPIEGNEFEPANWRIVLDNLREMRKARDAPVDSMGCDQCADTEVPPAVQRYQSLIALMLSSQTKDPLVHATMLKLRTHGLTVGEIIATDNKTLGELIYPVSFWKTKVKHIKQTTEILQNEFNNDIPSTIKDLLKLPGVGPKMAHLCMKTAWGEITGIGVDTHVHRISNRLGWVKTKTPEDTRKYLERWLPRELWKEVNHLMVGFGQQVCPAVKPNCNTCLNNSLCPFGITALRSINKGLKKVKK